MTRVGFITGLAVESRVLQGSLSRGQSDPDPLIACAGAHSGRAQAAAEALLAAGAGALVSYGIAGGLDPALRPGDMVLPESVLLPGGRVVPVHGAWRDDLLVLARGQSPAASGGTLQGSERVVAAVTEKQALFAASGAVAVDMESHAVGRVAQAAGVPFLVIRAVVDPADRPLPRAVVGSTRPDGEPRAGLIVARLALRPWEIAQINRLRRDARVALRALGRMTALVERGLMRREPDRR